MERETIYACLACGATQLVKWNPDMGENRWEKLREIGNWTVDDFTYCPRCSGTIPRPPQKYKLEDDRLVPLHV